MSVSSREDEGRPFGVSFQERASNRLKWLLLRVVVVSVEETSSETRQVGIRKTNNPEPLLTCRKEVDGTRTGSESIFRDKSTGYLIIV